MEQGSATWGEGVAIELLAEEIGIGMLVGALLAFAATRVICAARKAGWLGHVWQRMSVPALAILIFAVAQQFHGSGYSGAFVGGLFFRWAMREDVHEMLLPAEGIGELLALVAWALFGIMLLPAALPFTGWIELLYSLLSLTLVRMLPIITSLAGTGEPMKSKAFLAWFGAGRFPGGSGCGVGSTM